MDILGALIRIASRMISLLVLKILWQYLKGKPLAFQTLLDEMIKELLVTHLMVGLLTDLSHLEFLPSINPILALVLFTATLAATQNFLLQIVFTLGVRYICIFHQTWVRFLHFNQSQNVALKIVISIKDSELGRWNYRIEVASCPFCLFRHCCGFRRNSQRLHAIPDCAKNGWK